MFFTLFLFVFFVKVACDTPREDVLLQPAGGDNEQLGNHVEDTYKDELDKLGWLQPAQKKILSGLLHEVLVSPEILQVGSPRPWRAESVDINHRRQAKMTLDTDLNTVDMSPGGAFECPCISEFPADVAPLFAQRGFPADYGVKSCTAHDVDLKNATAQAETGCTPGPKQPLFCKMEWCVLVIKKRCVYMTCLQVVNSPSSPTVLQNWCSNLTIISGIMVYLSDIAFSFPFQVLCTRLVRSGSKRM
jgi:hypothetical protein